VDLEKAFDRVLREVISWAMRKMGVEERLVLAVMSIIRVVLDKGLLNSCMRVRVCIHCIVIQRFGLKLTSLALQLNIEISCSPSCGHLRYLLQSLAVCCGFRADRMCHLYSSECD